VSETFDSPNTGEYKLYPGGTPLPDAMDAVNAIGTASTPEVFDNEDHGVYPEGVGPEGAEPRTNGHQEHRCLLAELSKLTGKPVPAAIEAERGRVVDAMVDSHPYVHGKRFALVGDPDILLGMISLIMEMGGEPVHIVCTNGDKHFEAEANELLHRAPLALTARSIQARICGICDRSCLLSRWMS